MGKIVATVKLTNAFDKLAFEEGTKTEDAIRTYTMNMLADTGSVLLALPRDVVEHLGVSRRWLELRFIERFNRTPHQEIVRVRMDRACYLLRGSRLPLRLIAERCGYPLLHNFGRAFKKAVGQTPAAYRSEHSVLS